MTLPDGVSIDAKQKLSFVTQRGYWCGTRCQAKLCDGKCCPYTSCMFASLCMLLEHAGYVLPLARRLSQTPPENFVLSLHKASGAKLSSGSTIRHTQNALRALLPDAPVKFGALTDVALVDLLIAGAAIRLHINSGRLPRFTKRWVGGFNGGHAITIVGIRIVDGQIEVFWLDPMGRPARYSGEWTKYADVDQAIRRNARGLIPVTFTMQSAAVPVEPPPDPEEPPPDPDSLALAQAKAEIERLTAKREDVRAAYTELEAASADVQNAELVRDLSMTALKAKLTED